MLIDYTTIILALLALFCLNVIACALALGRMHAWLKGENEVFGDGAGLRDSIVRRCNKISNL